MWRGGDKVGLHIKDKFLDVVEACKMGTWGITMKQSDYGLDLLGTIVDARLKMVDFLSFHVADAFELIRSLSKKSDGHIAGALRRILFPISARTSTAILLGGVCQRR